jgi:hypothetical protein
MFLQSHYYDKTEWEYEPISFFYEINILEIILSEMAYLYL